MQGPILAGAIHTGPLWYYLFALPFIVAPAVLPAVLFVGVLAALKIPLAYAIGARFIDKPTGLLWALMLILPGWATFEGILVLHPSLVATCTLLFVWFAASYDQNGKPFDLIAAGVALTLAVHAHPSTFGLAFLLLAAIYRRHRVAKQPVRVYVGLAVAIVVPFAPYIVSQARAGFPDWGGAAGYLSDPHNLGSLRYLVTTLTGLFVTGPTTIVDNFDIESSKSPLFTFGFYGLIYAVAASGLVMSLMKGWRRPAIAGMAAAFLALLVCVVVIRIETPFYMTYVLWVFGAGLLALGVRAWFDLPVWRSAVILIIAVACIGTAYIQASIATTLERGEYAFALLPLFEITQPAAHGEPVPFVPVHSLAKSGALLCSAQSVSAHGALAVHLLHDYAIEARLACGERPHLSLGGLGDSRTIHWVGISRGFAEAVSIPVDAWIGPIGVAPVVQVINPRTGQPVPSLRTYPPATDLNAPEMRRTFQFDATPDEVVLVTNIYFTFTAKPQVFATANGQPIPVVANDQISSAYVCKRCAHDAPVHWRLDVMASSFERVDIVTVASHRPPQ